jgi:hypothetical protein
MRSPSVVFHGTVERCEETKTRHWCRGFGESAVFEERHSGWKYTLRVNGSLIGLECSEQLDGLEPGVRVRFSMEAVS